MTNDELKKLCESALALSRKATEGPWYPCGFRYTYISRELNQQEHEDIAEVCNHFRDDSQIQFNKTFIAESRTLLPQLASALLSKLNVENELQKVNAHLADSSYEKIRELEAENARLRSALEKIRDYEAVEDDWTEEMGAMHEIARQAIAEQEESKADIDMLKDEVDELYAEAAKKRGW